MPTAWDELTQAAYLGEATIRYDSTKRNLAKCRFAKRLLTKKYHNYNSTISAQFFDAFTNGKEFFTGSEDERSEQRSGQSSGYGAPQPSYGAPTSRPSYNAKPSYGGGGGKGINFKQIEIPVPDIELPNPLDFKAGVLRSKGRIASGLLHAKAGILRAGANILAQKANTLDKIAQAIPAVKAGLIQKLKGVGDKGGGGGYGAPSSGYNTPSSGYNAPQGPPSYNAPSSGYGVPQGPVLSGGGGASLSSTFNNAGGGGGYSGNLNNFGGGGSIGSGYNSGGNNFGSGSGFDSGFSSSGSGYNSGNFGSNNNFASAPVENFGGGGLTSGTVNNIPLTSSLSFGGGGSSVGNSFSSTGNSFGVSAPDSYGSPLADPISSFDNNQIITSSNFNNNNNLLSTNFNNNNNLLNSNQGTML